MKARISCWVLALLLGLVCPPSGAQTHAIYELNIESQPLKEALKTFAHQSGLQVVFFTEITAGYTAPAVRGRLTRDEALRALLRDTRLTFKAVNDNTVEVAADPSYSSEATSIPAAAAPRLRLAQAPEAENEQQTSLEHAGPSADKPASSAGQAIPEVLVSGSKILNMDIKRSRSDAQPYVVFERESIERSGAANLEDFFKNRLPMNTQGATYSQVSQTARGSTSQINLRGLGTSQTLILIDGHRVASNSYSAQAEQPDINGIPLSAVERIEILPTTASGIYGGSATGGVVNIILRRDYVGTEVKTTYDNTFDSDSAIRRVDISGGFSFGSGRTNVLLAGSYTDANPLDSGDRDFLQRGRRAIQANNPAFFRPANAPPLGATTNIRSATAGVNLTLKNGNTPLNSQFTFVPLGYAGTSSDGGAALLTNAGRYNLDLADTAQVQGATRSLSVPPRIESAAFTVRHELPRASLYLEGFASNHTSLFNSNFVTNTYGIAASAPNNPFNQSIQVTVPAVGADREGRTYNYDRRAVGGIVLRLPRGWSSGADYSWSQSRRAFFQPGRLSAAATAAISAGTFDVLRDLNAYPQNYASNLTLGAYSVGFYSRLKSATVRVSGPTFRLPAGAATVSGLLEYRDDSLSGGYDVTDGVPGSFVPDRSQTVASLYLETKIPLVSAVNARAGLRELELQVAARHDRYTVNGSTSSLSSAPALERRTIKLDSTDPTVGLRYAPAAGLMLRASYGTGFLPPTPGQVVPTPFNLNATTLIDPRRGNTQVLTSGTVATLFGGNSDLVPEQSESWSLGAVLTPTAIAGLRLSLDYTRIEKKDNITGLVPQGYIDNESLFPGRVVRGPVPNNDPYGVGPIVFLDLRLMNIAKAQVEAYDLQLDYRLETPVGGFDFFGVATLQTHYKTQLLETAPTVENVGLTYSNPLKFKANAGITWSGHRGWTAGWSGRYFDDYQVADPSVPASAVTIANQGGMRVPDQIYHDLFAGYRFSGALLSTRGLKALQSAELQLGVKNVLNARPPFDASFTNFYYSPLGDPRLASYHLTLKAAF